MALDLNDREQKLLINVSQCLQSSKGALPKVDMVKLVELGGYKNTNSANSVWYSLKKRLGLVENGAGTTQPLKLTDTEQKQLVNVFQCFQGGMPKIDLATLVTLGGYRNTNSANAVWYNLKQKLGVAGATQATAKGGSLEALKAKAKRKAAEIKDEDGEADYQEAVIATPKKKSTKRVKAEPVDETEDAKATRLDPFEFPAPMRRRFRSSKITKNEVAAATESAIKCKPQGEGEASETKTARAVATDEEQPLDAAVQIKAKPGFKIAIAKLLAEAHAAAEQCGQKAT